MAMYELDRHNGAHLHYNDVSNSITITTTGGKSVTLNLTQWNELHRYLCLKFEDVYGNCRCCYNDIMPGEED